MKVFFNDQIQKVLLNAINEATKSIYCAIYRFNDESIYESLNAALDRNVSLWMIINDDKDNLDLSQLIEKGANVYVIDAQTKKTMHNKFIVTDRKNLITGSYNWTYGAIHNYENVLQLQDVDICGDYLDEFESIKKEIDNFVKELIDKVLEEEDVMVKMLNDYVSFITDYIKKYKRVPPKELNNQFYKKSHDSNEGASLAIIPNPSTGISNSAQTTITSAQDIEASYIEWWNKLSTYWKLCFNFEVLVRGSTTAIPTNWEQLFGTKEISIHSPQSKPFNKTYYYNENQDFSPLSEIKSLTTLSLVDCNLKEVKDIVKLQNLISFHCHSNPLLDSLKGLENLPNLKEIVCDEKFYSKYDIERKRLEDAGFFIQKDEKRSNIVTFKRD